MKRILFDCGTRDTTASIGIVALRLMIDTWRWSGVPFYIRAGKHLPVTATEVLVELKRPPVTLDHFVPGPVASTSLQVKLATNSKPRN